MVKQSNWGTCPFPFSFECLLCRMFFWTKTGFHLFHSPSQFMDIVFLGCFPIHTGLTPPLTPQTILDACIQNFFEFQLCIGWGEGELQENVETDALFLEGTEKWQKNMNIAVLSTRWMTKMIGSNSGEKKRETVDHTLSLARELEWRA